MSRSAVRCAAQPPARTASSLEGIGASGSEVVGRAVVVLDPGDAEVDARDILIARTTGPSWVSLMFIANALVVDIGGLMSHAAVVARELAIPPCVMNTGNGTQVLRTAIRFVSMETAGASTSSLNPTSDAILRNRYPTTVHGVQFEKVVGAWRRAACGDRFATRDRSNQSLPFSTVNSMS